MNANDTPKSWSKRGADSPLSTFGGSENLVLLETADGSGPTLLFDNPLEIIRAPRSGGPLAALERLDRARREGLYVAGYFNYDALDALGEPTGSEYQGEHQQENQSDEDLLWFGVYEKPLLFDNCDFPRGSDEFSFRPASDTSARERFLEDIKKIKESLEQGDVYQVNYTNLTRFEFSGDPFALYRRLKSLQPARYCALIKNANRYILSFSPELFFELRQLSDSDEFLVETRPIKGTAPRGRFGREDRALSAELINDPKSRAENVMIVDLLRNDLGVFAKPGSVRSPELFAVDSLPTLHQLFSTVQGRVDPHRGTERLFRDIFPALFPCGSITGAPKGAARRLIRRLEAERRGIYTGSIGYAGPERAVFNVAIRTLEILRSPTSRNSRERSATPASPPVLSARYGSGCGIVWDSIPDREFDEYLLKQAFLQPALDNFFLIETIRLEADRLFFAREHFRRLHAAATFYQIPLHKDELRRELERIWPAPHQTEASTAWRLRLTVDRQGQVRGTRSPLTDPFFFPGTHSGAGRVFLAEKRIYSRDPFRRHKTSRRGLYDCLFSQARRQGYLDALILNEKDELVESATANVLLYDRNGRWLTPDTVCGPLKGTFLRFLERRFRDRIQPVKMKLQDLSVAKNVFLINSVRGLRRIESIESESGEVIYSG